MTAPVNCFRVDLEPWMCLYDKPKLDKKLDKGFTEQITQQLLDLLEKYNIKATFFVLAKLYEWYPELIREIAQNGHEIAFHTYSHNILSDQYSLIKELSMASAFIKEFKVKGFRAPQMYLPFSCLKVLREYGFIYDSSIYGTANKPIIVNGLIEIPVSAIFSQKNSIIFPKTLKDAIKYFEIPVGSGIFIGLFDARMLSHIIREINQKGRSFVMFIHPWQLTSLPKIEITWKISSILKLPYMIKIPKEKLRYLFERHTFSSIQMLLKEYGMA
jgi:peptidoglycan/xylan/chitin deacetylase (PgdA/CDA1 family)